MSIASLQPGIQIIISQISFKQGRNFSGFVEDIIQSIQDCVCEERSFMDGIIIFVQIIFDVPVVRREGKNGTFFVCSPEGSVLQDFSSIDFGHKV